jgi:hypothetical protein
MSQITKPLVDKPQFPVVSEIEESWKKSSQRMLINIGKQVIQLIDNELKPTHT